MDGFPPVCQFVFVNLQLLCVLSHIKPQQLYPNFAHLLSVPPLNPYGYYICVLQQAAFILCRLDSHPSWRKTCMVSLDTINLSLSLTDRRCYSSIPHPLCRCLEFISVSNNGHSRKACVSVALSRFFIVSQTSSVISR